MGLNPRLAVRALIVRNNRLLLVNAYPEQQSDLWCPPGGGVESGQSLPDNLRREILEECGAEIDVGAPCLVNEFHDPNGSYHQVDIYFRATLRSEIPEGWLDEEGVVNRFFWASPEDLKTLRHKPDSLGELAFGGGEGMLYDPLEPILM